jgi:hypothetical protein
MTTVEVMQPITEISPAPRRAPAVGKRASGGEETLDASLCGQFTSRPRAARGLINEPFASGIIYPAVLGAWAYVALYPRWRTAASWIALAFFAAGFGGTLAYSFRLGLRNADVEC